MQDNAYQVCWTDREGTYHIDEYQFFFDAKEREHGLRCLGYEPKFVHPEDH